MGIKLQHLKIELLYHGTNSKVYGQNDTVVCDIMTQ